MQAHLENGDEWFEIAEFDVERLVRLAVVDDESRSVEIGGAFGFYGWSYGVPSMATKMPTANLALHRGVCRLCLELKSDCECFTRYHGFCENVTQALGIVAFQRLKNSEVKLDAAVF
jgi:hypothetical protein